MLTLREHLKLRKSIRQNAKTHKKVGNQISPNQTEYGKKVEAKQLQKEQKKQDKKLNK